MQMVAMEYLKNKESQTLDLYTCTSIRPSVHFQTTTSPALKVLQSVPGGFGTITGWPRATTHTHTHKQQLVLTIESGQCTPERWEEAEVA